jgi:tripartite-type tricarboxylate transporter receptor subunit TctC
MTERKEWTMRTPQIMKVIWIAVIALLPGAVTSQAQTFPSKTVRIIVPYAPGGGVDALARAIAASLGPKWGQTIVVENKPGAATILGARTVADAAPDGHTMLLTSEATITSNPFLFAKLTYDPVRDLAPVTQLVSLPQMVVARAGVPAGSLAELAAVAKLRPDSLNYASYGIGSLPHLFFAGFNSKAGVDITHIPYRGIAPALAALLAGDVQLTLVGATLSQPHIGAGKLKPLAVAGAKRLPALPELPTIAEAGYAEADPGESWFGLFLTGGTPAAIVAKVHKDVVEAFADPSFRDRHIVQRGFDPILSTPTAFANALAADMSVKARLIKLSGAKVE